MAIRLPVAVLVCDLGDPVEGDVVGGVRVPAQPAPGVYSSVIGPRGENSLLAVWRDSVHGHFDYRGSRVSPVLRISVPDVIDDAGTPRDRSGNVALWRMSRVKMLDRAWEAAAATGMDMGAVRAVVVVVRQGRLSFRRTPVSAFSGGASSTSRGVPGCIVPLGTSYYTAMHEMGHALGFAEHAWGVETASVGWLPQPFHTSEEYGDPFCAMGRTFDGLDPGPLRGADAHPAWPADLHRSVVPRSSAAMVRRTYPQALADDDCVLFRSHAWWNEGGGSVRLYAAGDGTPGRTKLIVLEGSGSRVPSLDGGRGDRLGTYYIEYRPAAGRDRMLAGDPAHLRHACPAVVVQQLARVASCVPPMDTSGRPIPEYDASNPVCTKGSGDAARQGRRHVIGPRIRFRARVPVPGPLSRDWHAERAPYVRVLGTGGNGEWVAVEIRPPKDTGFREVRLKEPVRRERARNTTSGTQVVVTPCAPRGEPFRFTLNRIRHRIAVSAEVQGYTREHGPTGDSPELVWTVQGHRIPAPAAGTVRDQERIRVKARTERFDDGARAEVAEREVTVSCQALGNGTLLLLTDPADGNYRLNVGVRARDGGGGGPSPRTASTEVLVPGHELEWEPEYWTAVRGCYDRMMDLARDVQLKRPVLPRPDPRPGHRFTDDDRKAFARAMAVQAELARTDSRRAEQLAAVIALRFQTRV